MGKKSKTRHMSLTMSALCLLFVLLARTGDGIMEFIRSIRNILN